MKFLGLILGSFLVASTHASEVSPPVGIEGSKTIPVSSHMSRTEKDVRNAAVKVKRYTEGGHGSGSLIQYKDVQLVLTAQHVADSIVGTPYVLQHQGERRRGILIYSNAQHDIAVIWVEHPWEKGHAINWNPTEEMSAVGDRITYSGYPGPHSLMTYRGRVAGYEIMPDGSTNILLHTYGYFGCSGSVIYNSDKEIVGILWGIDSGRGIPIEDMIWVSPIQHLNMEAALRGLCQTLLNEPRACR